MNNNALFTVEEENLVCAFDASSRAELIAGIREALAGTGLGDPGMREIASSALRKLEAITDEGFSGIALSPAYGDESEV